MSAEHDVALVERFVEGDDAAFDELMRLHEDRVFGICLRLMGNREAAFDALQETFLTLYRKADRFKAEARFTTWLYRVTVNTCYDQLRKRKRHSTASLPEGMDPADPKAGDNFTAVELRPDVAGALAGLPEEFRDAIVLFDIEDMALEDVAEVLEVPVGTVKSRLYRGRRLLAENLGNLRPGSAHQTGETL